MCLLRRRWEYLRRTLPSYPSAGYAFTTGSPRRPFFARARAWKAPDRQSLEETLVRPPHARERPFLFGAPWPGKPFRPFQQQSITTQTAYRGRLTKTRSSGSSRQTLIFRRFGFPLQQISPEEASPQKRPSAKTPNRLGSKDICVQQRPTPRLRRDSGQSHPPRFPMARGVTTRMYSVSECVFPELSLRFFVFSFYRYTTNWKLVEEAGRPLRCPPRGGTCHAGNSRPT